MEYSSSVFHVADHQESLALAGGTLAIVGRLAKAGLHAKWVCFSLKPQF